MTDHLHTTVTPGCYRCELGMDELAAQQKEIRDEAQSAWLAYRDQYAMGRNLNARRVASQLRRRDFIAGYIAWSES